MSGRELFLRFLCVDWSEFVEEAYLVRGICVDLRVGFRFVPGFRGLGFFGAVVLFVRLDSDFVGSF